MIKLEKKIEKKIDLPCLKMVAQGRAYELLRAEVQAHIKQAHDDMGFKYCRFHGLFHDDMDVVYLREDGSYGYHWHHVDKVFDFLLSIGMKPFVELNPMPTLLASGTQTMFWYKMNVTPPKSYDDWYDLIFAFTDHVTARYGEDEVKQWFFEVWNEPNLKCFWSADQAEYFKLYKTSVTAVRAVCDEYKVGGPATATCAWVTDIIDYCCDNGLPLDFVSTHLYPQDEYCIYKTRENSPYEQIGDYFIEEVKKVKERVAASKRPDLPIYWTEFNTLSSDSAKHITFLNNTALDRLYGASCVCRCLLETMDYNDGVAYWTVSDVFEESQMRHTPFSGTYGLMTLQGIKKATYNAFELMKRLRGKRFDLDVSCPLGCGAVAAEENGTIRILMYNCKLPEIKDQPDWCETISIPGINASDYIFEQAKIEKGRGSAYEEWVKMGKPANLTPFEESYLRSCAEMHYSVIDVDGDRAEFEVCLKPDEVCCIEIHKRSRDVAIWASNEELEEQLNVANHR